MASKTFKRSESSLETTFAYCVICGDKSLSFGKSDRSNICSKCLEIIEEGNCLVIEDLYHDDEKIIGGRCMIVSAEVLGCKQNIVCMPTKEFDKYYEIYKVKNN